jgi:hypothetical protein
MRELSDADWAAVGDLICGVLETALGEGREGLERGMRRRGISFEQGLAAALAQTVRERLEQAEG